MTTPQNYLATYSFRDGRLEYEEIEAPNEDEARKLAYDAWRVGSTVKVVCVDEHVDAASTSAEEPEAHPAPRPRGMGN